MAASKSRIMIRLSEAELAALGADAATLSLSVAETARKRIVEALGLKFEPSKRGFANPDVTPEVARSASSKGGRNRWKNSFRDS